MDDDVRKALELARVHMTFASADGVVVTMTPTARFHASTIEECAAIALEIFVPWAKQQCQALEDDLSRVRAGLTQAEALLAKHPEWKPSEEAAQAKALADAIIAAHPEWKE